MKPVYNVKIIKNVLIPMEDGINLAADLYFPISDEKFPAILEYIPYRKDDNTVPRDSIHYYFAERGFVGVRVDIRGTGSSEGVTNDEYEITQIKDGYKVIEWLASQDWCNGSVGMWGTSYGGFMCLEVAMLNPPKLKAIVPVYATDDRYTDDCHYCGGALRAYYDVGFYGNFMIALNALPPSKEIYKERWESIWRKRLENCEPWIFNWLENQTDSDYWREALGRKYDKVKCPTFIIGGWRDGYPNPPLRLFQNLKVPKKLLMGPWTHERPHKAIPGPNIDFINEMVRWFGYWLKGIDTGITSEPPITIYVQTYDEPFPNRNKTSGYWRYEDSWPPKNSSTICYYLREKGLLEESKPLEEEGFDSFNYLPTIGTKAGLWSGGWIFCLPLDQREDEVYSLNYTSRPMEKDMLIIGNPVMDLYVSSSSDIAFFVVKLSDVAPDGTSALITKGILNATRRESFEDPKPLEPNKIYKLNIQLDATCWLIKKGHSLRISISGGDWPNLWPSPKDWIGKVYRNSSYPSSLTLLLAPLHRDDLSTPSFLPPPELKEFVKVIPKEHSWYIIKDIFSESVTVKANVASTLSFPNGDIYETEERMEAKAYNKLPANALVKGYSRKYLKRFGETFEVVSKSSLISNMEEFILNIQLEVYRNELPYFIKNWIKKFKRNLL